MSKPLSERSKVVVRNLPPSLTAEAFQATIDKHAEGTYNWVAYFPGKVSSKRTVLSRAFMNFNNSEAVIDFKQKFDGHVFVSTRGTQYKCSVEYAMFQKVPAANPKKLAMEGTIEKDPDYQAFVKALEEGPKALPTAQAQLEAQEAAKSGEGSGPVVTALMTFLQKKYESTPFTGRMSSKAARRREGAKLSSLLEEEPDTSKASKSRSKSSKSTATTADQDATAAAVSAATAASAEAAAHSARGGRQQHSKRGSKQQPDVQQGPATEAGSKKPSKHEKQKHDKRTASEGTSTAAAAPSTEEDAEAKRAAAAALAAASAANAAAAARKSRVKAGHQVYTPGARAGGKLFAAALPKPADVSVPASGNAGQTVAAASATASTAAAAASSTHSKSVTDKTDAVSATAAKPSRRGASSAGRKAAHAVDSPAATSTAAAASSHASKAVSKDDVGSSGAVSGKGGKGKSTAASTGKQQHQQQMWLPKTGSAG